MPSFSINFHGETPEYVQEFRDYLQSELTAKWSIPFSVRRSSSWNKVCVRWTGRPTRHMVVDNINSSLLTKYNRRIF